MAISGLFGQELIITANSLKPGLYMNYGEFMMNSPSYKLDSAVERVDIRRGALSKKIVTTLYTIDVQHLFNKSKELPYGFSDGESVYLRVFPRIPIDHVQDLVRSNLGLYAKFDSIDHISSYTNYWIDNNSIRNARKYYYEFETGKHYEQSNFIVKRFLKGQPDLLDDYKKAVQVPGGANRKFIGLLNDRYRLKYDSLKKKRLGTLETQLIIYRGKKFEDATKNVHVNVNSIAYELGINEREKITLFPYFADSISVKIDGGNEILIGPTMSRTVYVECTIKNKTGTIVATEVSYETAEYHMRVIEHLEKRSKNQ